MSDIQQLLTLGQQACDAYDRADLGARLGAARRRVEQPGTHVVVAGEFKQGKSSLVNALLNARVCPVDDDIATALVTLIRHGEEPSAARLVAGADDDELAEPRREPIPLDELGRVVTETAQLGDDTVLAVDVSLPRRLLSTGLVLVDTPGVGGLGSRHTAATMGAIASADAVLFVTDASQELTRSELDFLGQATDMCQRVTCVVSKCDFYPGWRRIIDLDRQHLDREGLTLEVLPASSSLRLRAVADADAELNVESGFPALVSHLSTIGGDGQTIAARRAVDDVFAVVTQLESQFRAELAALADPSRADDLLAELTELRERSERLASGLSRWSQTLVDGMSDVVSDVDHDLRSRIRNLLDDADAAIDGLDPADVWSEFEPWLHERATAEVVSNYRFLRDRAGAVATAVDELFEGEDSEVTDRLEIAFPQSAMASTGALRAIELGRPGVGRQGFTALRGFYSSTLMFSMFTSMAGVAVGPLIGVVGLVMGGKGVREERTRLLLQRRAQAKNVVRRYCDELSFHVGKDSRDTLRRVQRQLRDHYASRAEELHRSTTAALKAAQQAVHHDEATAGQRREDLEAELVRLSRLRELALDIGVRLDDEAGSYS